MTLQTAINVAPSAAIVAADEALCASVTLLLEMCGFVATGYSEPDQLLKSSQANEQFIFIDCTSEARRALATLRSRGWNGTAVIMVEGELASGEDVPGGPHLILAKPFSSDEVLSLVAKQNAD